jgi:organic hydroperoxide reductase OsmC/OhrA
MATVKEYRFPVAIEWPGGKLVHAHVAGKDSIEIATPPEFKSGIEGFWSPEDFLVAATASCFAVTLVAVAERADVPLRHLAIEATGRLGRRPDGRFGFTAIELEVSVETDEGREADVAAAAERAERGCLVSTALAIPCRVSLEVRSPVAAAI